MPWLDACFALGEDGPSFFPLLGTGGNDGRLEFTNNFMQRLADVIPFAAGAEPTATSKQWLAAALFADTLVRRQDRRSASSIPGGSAGQTGLKGSLKPIPE